MSGKAGQAPLAVLLVIAAPLITLEVEPTLRGSFVFTILAMTALTIVLLAAFIPAIFEAARDASVKERSAVWLGAYQDELARRHRLRGREARRWRRVH